MLAVLENSTAILRTSNNADAVKSKAYADALEHLRIIKLEQSMYKSVCDQCRDDVLSHFTVGSVFRPPSLSSQFPPNSQPIRVHYSFDYAQQIHFPSDPLQPGPVYFPTARNCSLFGVHCEALPWQVNFLTDEAGDCGKGTHSVVSQLHYFFTNHGMGEKEVFLHCDNCTGQNKNNCMIQYLLWRVLTRQHTRICLSFLVVGHTKFAPDWCFGLFKRLFRRSKVGNINDIAQVVNSSAQCNVAQLVCNEDGSTIVPTYNWIDFFAPHVRKLLGIKHFHHFMFDAADPGAVTVKVQADPGAVTVKVQADPGAVTVKVQADAGAVTVKVQADPGAVTVKVQADPGAVTVKVQADPGAVTVKVQADPGAVTVKVQDDPGAVTVKVQADPGAVTVKVQSDIDEIRIVLLKDHWQPGYDMPNVVVPKGLSTQRK